MCRHATCGSRREWQQRMSQCRRSKGTQNPADIFTKAASRETVEKHRKMLGLRQVEAHSSQKELRLESLDRKSDIQPELHWNAHGVNAGDESANVDESDTVDKSPWTEVKAKSRTKEAFIQTSCKSVSQRNSSKMGIRQAGQQLSHNRV